MNESIIIALIAGGFAIIGSAVTGAFTYYATEHQRETERYKRYAIRALRDVIAFYRLEQQYTDALATESKTAEAWKREIRKHLRDDGFDSPSQDATIQKCSQRIADLE